MADVLSLVLAIHKLVSKCIGVVHFAVSDERISIVRGLALIGQRNDVAGWTTCPPFKQPVEVSHCGIECIDAVHFEGITVSFVMTAQRCVGFCCNTEPSALSPCDQPRGQQFAEHAISAGGRHAERVANLPSRCQAQPRNQREHHRRPRYAACIDQRGFRPSGQACCGFKRSSQRMLSELR